ncbi:nucleotidyltransferase domain-containing protein [Streptomyces broussonetiae]|uniref:nucleotidyltransferase domain-containing protein n=1 Tax=Streptomyces broussonetiae TaxID=2686304 RepID=UPI0035D5A490
MGGPVRFVLSDQSGREVDLHPPAFGEDGSAVQASPDPERPFPYLASCFVSGVVAEAVVRHGATAPGVPDRHTPLILDHF